MAVEVLPWPTMHPVDGVRIGVAQAGVKYPNRDDVVVFEFNEGAAVSGVFTQNAFAAAPVHLGRQHLLRGDSRYFVINSGNANACTGDRGERDALGVCAALAELADVLPQQVIPFSTGVIGEFLPVEKIKAAIPSGLESLSSEAWGRAGRAIMTTDTFPKGASEQFVYDGETITVTGIAKGAGMIRPNMATMLAYMATDAVVAQPLLDQMLKTAVNQSFNRITVDGDTSTNDSCMLVASGLSGMPMLVDPVGELFELLQKAIIKVAQQLAIAIVIDGEGATKFVTVEVLGGASSQECLKVAYAIARSPLVKTALFASDANWGRIIAAVGNAGIPKLDHGLVKLWLDDVLVVEGGARAEFYQEGAGAEVVSRRQFSIKVDLGRGKAEEKICTSDLSHEYVTINAEYRT